MISTSSFPIEEHKLSELCETFLWKKVNTARKDSAEHISLELLSAYGFVKYTSEYEDCGAGGARWRTIKYTRTEKGDAWKTLQKL